MQIYRIIGHPLSFCLTTPVMNGAFKELGMEAKFETVDLAPENLENVMKQLRSGELSGVVATMPYKTPSIDFLDTASEEVTLLHAVNVILSREGKLHGYNTDWMGAIGAVKTVEPELKGKHILVLGAGGAARAAAYGLKKEGAQVAVWNRTPERAKAFAEEQSLEWVEDLSRWEQAPDIIVNATASSNADRQSTLVPFPLWKNVTVALDAVYGKTSLFLEEAQAAHVPHVLSGEVWFLNQIFHMCQLITGQEGPRELMTRLTHESKEIRGE